jgi:hypothetical protein
MTSEANEIAAIYQPAPVEAEVSAMHALVEGLGPLDVRARRRVLDWAAARFKDSEPGMEGVMKFMNGVLEAIGDHQKATKQARQIDRDLWELTIKGTKYWTEPAEDDR